MRKKSFRTLPHSRRSFLKNSALFAAGSLLLPEFLHAAPQRKVTDIGIQLYTVGAEMKTDLPGTLKKVTNP